MFLKLKDEIYKAHKGPTLTLDLYSNPVSAGFPSPAEDHLDSSLDLNEYLIKHPSATFYIYAKGHSMNDIGIYDGDVMIVDRALEAKSKDIIIAVINGEFTVKRIYIKNNSIYLVPENKTFKSILVEDDMDFQIWGVVTHTIHSFK
jgi:DNA polymerase V|tara:strand:- start:132 stop:569 length:438 start_codon:yes stop_codon:yes gene_type:complete